MAENKKSFLLYADLIHTVRKMPKDKVGELLLTILEYVNDENPEITDNYIEVVFEPIKQQLKRDLQKYRNIVGRNKINGSKGGRPSKAKKPTGLIGMPEEPRKADSVNDTVTVSVNDSELKNKDLNQSFKNFVDWFNKEFNREFKALKKLEAKYKSTLKEFSNNELATACRNAYQDEHHIKSNFKYLTIEFMLRPDKIDLFLNKTTQKRKFDEELKTDSERNDFLAGRIKVIEG